MRIENIPEQFHTYAEQWAVFVAEDGDPSVRLRYRVLCRHALRAGMPIPMVYPDGSPLHVEYDGALKALDAWCAKGRYFTMCFGGGFQPGDGAWIELHQTNYRGAKPRKLQVSDYELEDPDGGISATLEDVILEALAQWKEGEK